MLSYLAGDLDDTARMGVWTPEIILRVRRRDLRHRDRPTPGEETDRNMETTRAEAAAAHEALGAID